MGLPDRLSGLFGLKKEEFPLLRPGLDIVVKQQSLTKANLQTLSLKTEVTALGLSIEIEILIIQFVFYSVCHLRSRKIQKSLNTITKKNKPLFLSLIVVTD